MVAEKKRLTEEEARRIRADGQVTVAMNYIRERRDEEALRMFDEVLADDPGNGRAMKGRALALGRLGRSDEALETVAAMLRNDPHDARAYDARASVYEYMGRLEEARAEFERALALEPEGADQHYNFACYWAARGDAEQCRHHLAEALRLDPPSHVYAATDVDLERYREEEWFQELVAFKK
ncbi:MAG TPA: tetratricopeptide repeat protein [bacterium]|nr:tetratricopeptide repeat protein [bacterium]